MNIINGFIYYSNLLITYKYKRGSVSVLLRSNQTIKNPVAIFTTGLI